MTETVSAIYNLIYVIYLNAEAGDNLRRRRGAQGFTSSREIKNKRIVSKFLEDSFLQI